MEPKTKWIVIGIISAIIVIVVIVVAVVMLKKKKEKFEEDFEEYFEEYFDEDGLEGFSPAQKIKMAARYAKYPNYLMPSNKAKPATNKLLLPLNPGTRGDIPMDYLLPNNGVKKNVAEEPKANVKAAPPVIGGTETKKGTPPAAGVALNVTTEDAIKAGANSVATTDFHDQSVPDTSALPAVVQNGVVPEPAKEGYCGGNTRTCPQFIQNGSFIVQHKLQKGGISTSKEGFRPSKHNL